MADVVIAVKHILQGIQITLIPLAGTSRRRNAPAARFSDVAIFFEVKPLILSTLATRLLSSHVRNEYQVGVGWMNVYVWGWKIDLDASSASWLNA